MARKRPSTIPVMPAKRLTHDRTGEKPVLVLQGGGALGAYQAGVYEELAGAGIEPEWVAGISIGAINAALIVGNPPGKRVEHLKAFWDEVSSTLLSEPPGEGHVSRLVFNEMSAGVAALFGVPGFFRPRLVPAVLQPRGSRDALSHYDTRPLRKTLERLVDFDRINDPRQTRLSVGAVNIRSGNFVYFDSMEREIGPEHIMASGALPPGFPPVEIDGELYWDGGIVSNTPLQYVFETERDRDMLIFQVDLFSARGALPSNLIEVEERSRDIQFSSRTRLNTDALRHVREMHLAAKSLAARLPEEFRTDPDLVALTSQNCGSSVSIVHLIYRHKRYETRTRDYEFSRKSVREHWQAGQNDVRRTLRHRQWTARQRPEHGVAVFDLTRDAAD